MIKLNKDDIQIAKSISRLKEASGSHSPSVITLNEKIPSLKIAIDACFLSNPYATDLFLNRLQSEVIDTGRIRDVLEYYPSQNEILARILSDYIRVPTKNIFIGNGATEIIQAVIHNFVEKDIVIMIPTFSSYYEFVKESVNVHYYQLLKENNYQVNIDDYLESVNKIKPDTIVLINPNNPDGGYIPYPELRKILNSLKWVKNIIIDESFIHFAFEDAEYTLMSAAELFKDYKNVIVIKSMSKDFGIAGIRAGYGIMESSKVNALLQNGYLWNMNGLAEYFFRLYVKKSFQNEYNLIRKKYILHAHAFFGELNNNIPNIRVYPSMANFILIELLDGSTSSEFVSKMLIKYGIYTRSCSDKIGLDGEYIRLAARTEAENKIISNSIKLLFDS
jgi:histidinol-phosphate/aromatic aminotransferase/cobyric acid decarboxylase-like protein